MFAKVDNFVVPIMFCNLAILIFASSIHSSLMSTLQVIICVYLAINLALLVFEPVRKSWQWWFPHCYSINELWKGLFNPEVIGEDKWWKKPFIFVVFILVMPVYLLYAVLSTLIPILVYRDAIAKYKR